MDQQLGENVLMVTAAPTCIACPSPDVKTSNIIQNQIETGQAMASQQKMGDSNRRQWSVKSPAPTFPLEMQDRGITAEQYNADISRIRAAVNRDARNKECGLIACFLCLCCLWPCAICLISGFCDEKGESIRGAVTEIAPKYEAQGISWDLTLGTGDDFLLSYEW